MKNKIIIITLVVLTVIILILTNTRYPKLKENAIAFTMEEYKSEIDTNNKNINIPSFIDNGDYGYWTKGDKNE